VELGVGCGGFNDVTGVEKSCVAKAEKGKKVKDNCCIIATEYAFPKNMECIQVCDVYKIL